MARKKSSGGSQFGFVIVILLAFTAALVWFVKILKMSRLEDILAAVYILLCIFVFWGWLPDALRSVSPYLLIGGVLAIKVLDVKVLRSISERNSNCEE